MRCFVSRIAAACVLTLIGACFDPNPSDTGASTGDDSTGVEPTGASASATGPTSSMSATNPSTTGPTTTESTSSSATEPGETTMATSGDTETTVVTEESSASSSGTSGGMPTTIQEIQMGAIPLDSAVEVAGAIVTGVGGNGFFMQDPAGGEWSGIWVFTGMGGLVPQLGDELTVTGVYEEYFDLSEINASDGTIEVTMSPGEANVPVPETLEALDFGESWESVFVRIAGTLVVEEVGMGAVHEFSVDDGAGSLWIDDQLYDATLGDFTAFGVGATFTEIRGPVNFSFKQYKVAPRSVDDLMGYTPPL